MTPLTAALLLLAPAQEPAPRAWTVGGVRREALVFAPAKKAPGKVPLVFDFHGHGGTARGAARRHALHKAWPEAVVVYMQGLNTPGRLTDREGKKSGWQPGPGDQGDRDLAFFDAVLASMKKDYPVDEKRIYATGHSNGGGFTYLLWAKRGDAFAAFAPVAAAGHHFVKAGPKPLFHAAGKNDPLVTFAMQRRTLERARKVNRCEGEPREWAKGCLLYPSKADAPVVVYLHDEGHRYPTGVQALVVRFFKEHPKK